jgi:hypothetical protein
MCLGTAIPAAVCASKRTGQMQAAAAAAGHSRSSQARPGSGTAQMEAGRGNWKRGDAAGRGAAQLEAADRLSSGKAMAEGDYGRPCSHVTPW